MKCSKGFKIKDGKCTKGGGNSFFGFKKESGKAKIIGLIAVLILEVMWWMYLGGSMGITWGIIFIFASLNVLLYLILFFFLNKTRLNNFLVSTVSVILTKAIMFVIGWIAVMILIGSMSGSGASW